MAEPNSDDPHRADAKTTLRDVARIEAKMGGTGEAFTTTLRAFPRGAHFGALDGDEAMEFVAAQVYATVDDATTAQAREYVEHVVAALELESLADVNDALGRESYLQQNYDGQLAFVR